MSIILDNVIDSGDMGLRVKGKRDCYTGQPPRRGDVRGEAGGDVGHPREYQGGEWSTQGEARAKQLGSGRRFGRCVSVRVGFGRG